MITLDMSNMSQYFGPDFFEFHLSGPVISSLTIMAILAILSIIVGILAKRADPTKAPKGLLLLVDLFMEKIVNWTKDTMGRENVGNWPAYFFCLTSYLFISFIWSLTGFPSVIDYLLMPFTLALVMFVLIHVTAIRYQKWSYFHRYIEPLKIWLPINLVTMWTPIISTSLRMFGNCLSGSVVLGILSWALRKTSLAIFGFMGSWGQVFLAPIPLAILNLYFSLFSGFIQTLVFASLNAVWISQEMPDEEAMGVYSQASRGEN